jgi:integrase
MKAERLPSGNWRVRVTYMQNGERKFKSFTSPDKKEALYLAARFQLNRQQMPKCNLTLGEAIDKYVEERDAILSPSTVVGYKKIRNYDLQSIMHIKIKDLTQEDIQKAVNEDAKTKAPKSIRNSHGLLSAVLRVYRKDFILTTTLPRKVPTEITIPENDEVVQLFETCKKQDTKVIIMLAAMLGLRRSEICALKWDDIRGDQIRVDEATVKGDDGLVTKTTKTTAGFRMIAAPQVLITEISKLPRNSETVINLTPAALSSRWRRLKEKTGIKCRFHDLRHYCASVMLALGVPDKYAMERMGHATPDMLKRVYQHVMSDKRKEVAQSVNSYFDSRGVAHNVAH